MRRVSHGGGGRSRRPAGWLMVLVVGCLGVAACTGSDDVDLESGDAGLASAASPTESGEDGVEADEASTEEQDESSTDETTDDENDDDGEELASGSTPEGFVPPVRFENGEHESAGSIDQQLVEEKLAEAALAAFNNWRSCITLGKECNYERDVAPLLSSGQEVSLRLNLLGYREGERLIPGEQDNVVVSEVEAIELTPPILGQVFLCVVDSGVQLIEAGPGREEEIVDDSVFAYVVGYQLASDSDGVLTVEGEWNVVAGTEDVSLCDEFSQ